MHPMYSSQPPSHYRGMPGGMSAPGMHMQQQMQCYCPACNTLLSFPSGANFVQCPQCQTTMNTQPTAQPPIAPPPPPAPVALPAPPAPNSQLNFLHCPSCQCLLSHPPTSITIQCPRCMHIIDVSHKAATLQTTADLTPTTAPTSHSANTQQTPTKSQPTQSTSPQQQEFIIRKKRKDPNAPKRASNAYMIFCKERRAQLKLDRPDLPFGQLGKRLGEMWRSMPADEKKMYEDRATGDRDRYKGEMNSYQSTAMMKGGRGSAGAKRHAASHDTGSEGDGGDDEDDEGDDGSEGGGSGHDDEPEEEVKVQVREKSNGDVKRAKHEVKVDTDTQQHTGETQKEPPSE